MPERIESKHLGLFGVFNPEGVLLRVLSGNEVDRFVEVIVPYVQRDIIELLFSNRPDVSEAEGELWVAQRAAGYKLVLLG